MTHRPTRRRFIQTAAITGAAFGLGCARQREEAAAEAPAHEAQKPHKPLSILILGGTAFLGPAIVEEAIERGHSITLFNRGRTNADLFPNVEKLRGDRDPEKDEGLNALKNDKTWDVCIDTSGYIPRHVKASAELLAPRVGQYAFVSTVSVYPDKGDIDTDETYPVATIEDETVEKVDAETYGPLKALCEQAAEAALPGRTLNLRPGLIVGPRDRSDRFTYWPVRVRRGGEMLCPNTPQDLLQVIDVRDLGNWILDMCEQSVTGVFNLVGPEGRLTFGELLGTCKEVSGSNAEFTYVSKEFIESNEIAPWAELPCWLPPEGDYAGWGTTSNAKALASGLTFRPLADTVRDTLAWWDTLPEERRTKMRAGIAPEREAELLAKWHEEVKAAG
jgi:2'-hydroxyisoflavone reductase